jgi:hypothetical protein
MALKQSKTILAGSPVPNAIDAANAVLVVAEYEVKTGDAVGDVVEMTAIPQGCIVADVWVETGALGAGVTLDAGVLTGTFEAKDNARTIGNEFFAAQAAATASVIRKNKSALGVASVAPNHDLTPVGIKFLGAAPTVGQKVRFYLLAKSKPQGV